MNLFRKEKPAIRKNTSPETTLQMKSHYPRRPFMQTGMFHYDGNEKSNISFGNVDFSLVDM